jgi:hypothetical protein
MRSIGVLPLNEFKLFEYLDIETSSMCNRICPTCIRNSHPDREAISSFFEPTYLSIETIMNILEQCKDLGFKGSICLSHFNEPLLDERLPQITNMIAAHDWFHPIYFHTNGDYMTEELASGFDRTVDKIVVSLYMDEPKKSERAEWIKSLFHKTQIVILPGTHIPTHFSPKFDIQKLIFEYRNNECTEIRSRVIINHRRQFLVCCEDVIGNFGFGNFPDVSIKDYWFGDKHVAMVNDLKESGRRMNYEYCSICPKS